MPQEALMRWNKIALYAVDVFVIVSALPIAVPFALVISAPFLGGL